MVEDAIDVYCDAFVAPKRHELDSAPVVHVAPGVRDVAFNRLLVSDDSGYERVVMEVTAVRRGVVFVFEKASRCQEFLRGQPGWRVDATQLAMVLGDIQAATGATLPDGLDLRPVNRVGFHAPDGVPLEDAMAVAIASDPDITEAMADDFARYLGGLSTSVRLFVAVDENGSRARPQPATSSATTRRSSSSTPSRPGVGEASARR